MSASDGAILLGATEYRQEFASLLGGVRGRAQLSVRAIAEVCRYSHPQIARATTGRRLPVWPLVRAILDACGVGGEELARWQSLWECARDAEVLGRTESHTDEEAWNAIWTVWRTQVMAIRKANPTLDQIRRSVSLDGLGEALATLTDRNGAWSLRRLEARTGISKSTLHGWYTGTRRPSADKLMRLLVTLDATRAEQIEFAHCLARLEDGVVRGLISAPADACRALHQPTGKLCHLSEYHRGPHHANGGTEWLDDDEPDGPVWRRMDRVVGRD